MWSGAKGAHGPVGQLAGGIYAVGVVRGKKKSLTCNLGTGKPYGEDESP